MVDECVVSAGSECFSTIDASSRIELMVDSLIWDNERLLSRIAQDLSLSDSKAREAFVECVKFLYLHKLKPGSYTPSKLVDEVWHIFLLFTRSYQNFCAVFIVRFIHHEPGIEEEGGKFIKQYDLTLLALQEFYGEPNCEFWPQSVSNMSLCGSCESN